jgi:rRNA maturation protein Nop10
MPVQIQSICWLAPRCGRFTLEEKTGTHCIGDLLGLGACMDDTENLTPPGFDPGTTQPVATRYTDYATTTARKN